MSLSAKVGHKVDAILANSRVSFCVINKDDVADKCTYVQSVVAEILEKDVQRRVQVRNIAAFKRVQTYIINNFGATTSLSNVHTDLKM
jgi:predicted AAA+ superfamily ATPase